MNSGYPLNKSWKLFFFLVAKYSKLETYMDFDKSKIHNRESYKDLLYCVIHRNPAVFDIHQNAFNTSEIREIPSLSLLNFWKDYNIRTSLGEINNNPCKLMRRGLYRSVYTKYLRHWVIWERKYLHCFVQKSRKEVITTLNAA